MGELPDVAVVVSTRDRAALLPRLVDALERQDLRRPFEVVIVDDGSADATPQVLVDLERRTTLDLRVVRHERSRGPAAGRNTGWRISRAPVIAFTDDDTVPQPGWLSAGLDAAAPGHGIVVGRTRANPDQMGDIGPFSRTLDIAGVRFYETCNIFYDRADLERVGGFDERFTRPGGEDVDLALRVLGTGAESRYAEDAVVHHDVHPSRLATAFHDATRWTGVPLLFGKHPELRAQHLRHGIFWKDTHEYTVLAAVGLLAGKRLPVALLLTLPWLRLRLRPGVLSRRRVLPTLPIRFALDLIEVASLVGASVRHGTLVI
ncbi:MAG: glycosyltransferase [Actinobacteria bacterium]|nr:glycosyltransferase [Actinomycetota bacterium]